MVQAAAFLARIPNLSFSSPKVSGEYLPESPINLRIKQSIQESALSHLTLIRHVCIKAYVLWADRTQTNARIRESLVRALPMLAEHGEEVILRTLVQLLDDPDARCRQAAVSALLTLAKVLGT